MFSASTAPLRFQHGTNGRVTCQVHAFPAEAHLQPENKLETPAWGWKSRFKASRNQHLNRSLRPGNTWRSLSFLETRCVGKEMEEANRTNFLGGPPKENGRCPHVSFWPREPTERFAGSLLIRSLPPKKDPGQFLENWMEQKSQWGTQMLFLVIPGREKAELLLHGRLPEVYTSQQL